MLHFTTSIPLLQKWRKEESPRVGKTQKKQKQKNYSLLETAEVSHEEAAPVLPSRERIGRSGLVSPGGHLARTEHYRRTTWAALTQGRGHRSPRGGDGSEGVLSWVSTAPQSLVGAEEKYWERVMSLWFIKSGCGSCGCKRNCKHSHRGMSHRHGEKHQCFRSLLDLIV